MKYKPLKNKQIADMIRKEFEDLPCRTYNEDIGLFDTLIILPASGYKTEDKKTFVSNATKRLRGEPPEFVHDSGYRFMDFVAAKGEHPICRLAGGSDVIHIDGIGGYGEYKDLGIPKLVLPKSWSIDCLPKSGLLRLFCGDYKLSADAALSSFEIFAVKKES